MLVLVLFHARDRLSKTSPVGARSRLPLRAACCATDSALFACHRITQRVYPSFLRLQQAPSFPRTARPNAPSDAADSRSFALCATLPKPELSTPTCTRDEGAGSSTIHDQEAECHGMTPPLHLSLLHLCSHLPISALVFSLAPHASSILNLCRSMLLHRQLFEMLAPPDTPGRI